MIGVRTQTSARYSTKASRSWAGAVLVRSDSSAAAATAHRVLNSISQASIWPNGPVVAWLKL